MNDDTIITCGRCGSEMKADSRYCMKCGNLNPNHPDNNKYSKILKKTNQDSNYQLGSGKKLYENKERTGMNFISEKNKNRMVFILFNVIIIAILCLISILPLLSIESYTIDNVLESGIFTNLLTVGIFSIFFVSSQILFIKINENWWCSLIPVYNMFLLSRAVFNNSWVFILMFIPVVNSIYFIVLYYKLGVSFGKSGILTVLFSPIMIPIIAFGSSSFNKIYYVTDYSPESLEKTYGSYKKFAEFSIFLVFIGFLGFAFSSDFIKSLTSNKDEVVLLAGGKTAVSKVKNSILKGNVSCMDPFGSEVFIISNGEYYFYSEDFLYDYGLRSNLVDDSRGYVKVINKGGNYSYYIAYTTSEMGVRETNVEDLSVDKVEKNVVISPPAGNMCTID